MEGLKAQLLLCRNAVVFVVEGGVGLDLGLQCILLLLFLLYSTCGDK